MSKSYKCDVDNGKEGHKPKSSEPVIEPLSSVSSYACDNDENVVRGNWTGKLDFILSCLSYAVGLGNVWRFPYQCYKNGGGAFVLPFLLMLVVTGIPLFFLESAFGQYAGCGVVSIWKAVPLFQGIGYAMFMVSFLVSVYYNVIIAWTFFFLFSSFTKVLPWQSCDNEWNTPACHVVIGQSQVKACREDGGTFINSTCTMLNKTQLADTDSMKTFNYTESSYSVSVHPENNDSVTGKTVSPAEEFFNYHVLDISSGVDDIGSMRWQLVLCLLLSWILVCVCMIKGIKTSGRAVYFTSTFPYLVLLILLVRSVTLPGSIDGIAYFFTPKWNKLLEAKVWCDAAVQIFFSLAPGWGGLITLSSYNKFKNNCLRDAYLVCVGDCLTSLFAGMVIFAIIGYLAFELDQNIDHVVADGPGLAFIAYPEVVTRLPASPLWAILFFLMVITLGLGTQFAIVNTVHTTIIDMFPKLFHKGHRPSFLMIILCVICFFMGLLLCTQGGMYWLELMDSYCASYSVIIIAVTECLVLAWIYGYSQLQADIKLMLGKCIGPYWMISWKFLSPAALLGIFAFQCIQFKRKTYNDVYLYPWWADLLGWFMTLSSVIFIPGVAVYKLGQAPADLSFKEKLKFLTKSADDWGPAMLQIPSTLAEKTTITLSKNETKEHRASSGSCPGDSEEVTDSLIAPTKQDNCSTEATIESQSSMLNSKV